MSHQNDRAVIGDNNPPNEGALAISKFADDLEIHLENAKPFLDGTQIESDEEAELVQRILDDNKELHKKLEAKRKELVKPLDEAKGIIQDEFNVWIQNNRSGKGKLIHIAEAASQRQTEWHVKLEAKRKAEERRLQEQAEKAEQERLEAMQVRNLSDFDSKIAAEEAIEAEKKIQADLKRVQNTRVGTKADGRKSTLREIKVPDIVSYDLLLLWIQEHRLEALNKFCEEIAAKEFRSKNYDIYGVKIKTEHKSW